MKTTKTTSPALMKIPVRLLATLLFLFQTSSYAGLVGQWVADDWTGGTASWIDRVAGKLATVASPTNSPVKTPGAIVGTNTSSGIVFDGINDYLLVYPTQNPIQGKNSVTIVAFFNSTQGASGADGAFWQYPGPLNGESPGYPNDWGLTYNAAGNAQGFFNVNITPSPAVSVIGGQPHTMILTWQDPSVFPGQGVARLYVDGALVGSYGPTDGGSGVFNLNGFVIGSDREGILLGGPRFFSGAIGELRFYDSIEDPAAIHFSMLGALVATRAPTAMATGTATLNGFTYPGDLPVDAHFRFGTDPTLAVGTDTPEQAVAAGAALVPVSQPVVGLSPDIRYYFQMVVTNANGTFKGSIKSFFLGSIISVEQPAGTSLADGLATVNYGGSSVGATTPKTFTIKNSGDLPMTGLSITKDGANSGDFSVGALGSTLAPGASTAFTVNFTPSSTGGRNAAIHIASNVIGSTNPFDIVLTGTGLAPVIWTGPSITFTHPDYSSNYDQITPDVLLTRGYTGGIQNYGGGAIEWAVGTTANLGALTFNSYQISYGVKPPIGPNLVLHIINGNIFLNFRILSWTDGGGGGFSYTRATPLAIDLPPVANAGTDFSVNEGQTGVALNGSLSSDPDGDPLTFAWTQVIGGTAVTLSGANTASPTFTAPVVAPGGETLSFDLTVTANGKTSTDTVSVTVVNVNHPPVADAGADQSIAEGSPVTLDGSASFDADTDLFTYAWVQVANGSPTVTLSDPTAQKPTFTAPYAGTGGATGVVATLVFELLVDDGFPADAPATGYTLDNVRDRVTVEITNTNNLPVANAGADQTLNENSAVALSGTLSSDPDSDTLTYAWTQTGGPVVTLTGGTTAIPSFTAPFVSAGGADLTFSLTVDDGYGGTAADTVVIHVQNSNDPPLASAAQPTVALLWPPNHQMIAVGITGVSDPNNNATITITSVTQDEPTNGLGDGDTAIDAVIDADGTVLLRSERSGKGDGRVYRISFTASDLEGSSSAVVKVFVPHSVKKPAIDSSGVLYNSTN